MKVCGVSEIESLVVMKERRRWKVKTKVSKEEQSLKDIFFLWKKGPFKIGSSLEDSKSYSIHIFGSTY